MSVDRFETIRVGDEAEVFHTITAEDVETFARLTGDDNPLHMDEKYAKRTTMGGRVVHGMLSASFISRVIGTKLPGEGALWYEQRIQFLAPVRIGEKIRVWALVQHKSEAQRILVIKTVVFGEGEKKVIDGEARVKVLEQENRGNNDSKRSRKKGAMIITGSSRGIGAAVARKLAAEGYPVIINYIRNAALAQNILDEITSKGGRAIAVQADVTSRDEVSRMVSKVIESFPVIEGIVCNASPAINPLAFAKLSWDNIQKHIDVQVQGAFHLCQAVLPHFLEVGSGAIVLIGSIAADNVPPIEMAAYCTAKSALVGLTRCLAAEFGPKGIRVNMVSPGMTHTDLTADMPEKTKMVAKMQTPLRRLALPEDIAEIVVFLLSMKAQHITGQNIRACGGSVML